MTPRTRDVPAGDGTRLRVWDNGVDGPALVVSNGLGASPAAWPWLHEPDCGWHAVTWHHRGLGGSARPADESRIRIADHADDLETVMDASGMTRATVVGWSVGVTVALEVARRSPSRVAALLLLGGTAGSFRVLPRTVPAPGAVRRGVALASAWALRLVGPPLRGVSALAPAGWERQAALFGPGWSTLAQVAGDFAGHDWTWFSRSVLATVDDRVDLAGIRAPVTVVAGELDTLAPVADLADLAAALPDARLVRVPGSHFLPLQFPGVLSGELSRLRGRSGD